TLLLSGASAGAIIRRSGRVVRATARVRRPRRRELEQETVPDLRLVEPAPPQPAASPVDVVTEFPDVVETAEPAPLLLDDPDSSDEDQTSLFDVGEAVAKDYRLPDRAILRHSPKGAGISADQNAKVA